MSILLVGLNHRTAPVEIREQLAFSRDGAATALLLFRNQFPGSEAAILSTCNRVEILIASDADRPDLNDVISFLAQSRDLPVNHFKNYLYQLSGEKAVRHLFRVASGMDSMVVGESQIVNQAKQAYALASEQGTTGRTLNRLFHHAFEVSKRVRTDTQLSEGKVSIPSVAVEVARGIFSDFSTKQTLIVGAGEMAQLVCEHLRESNCQRFVVTTRTLTNAKALADACNGVAAPFTDLPNLLIDADIIITATGSPTAFLTTDRLRAAQKARRGRPLFIIDLSVPRNVEPDVKNIENVYLYDIDALGAIVAANQQERLSQLSECESILDCEVKSFIDWFHHKQFGPMIERMYRDATDLRDFEVRRLFNRLPDLTEHQREVISQSIGQLVGKFMHPCVASVRRSSDSAPHPVALANALHALVAEETGN
jgi:glutamyl-tRNA reductase